MNTSHDELNGTVIHIDAAGSGDFRTLGEGLAWLESRQDTPEAGGAPDSWTTFSIAPGTYREKVFVDLPRVRFRGTGAGPESVRIVWADHARMTLPDGRPIRTFNSFTLFVGGDHFRAENLTVANDAGSGDQVGQAVAAYVDADDVLFRNCQLLVGQHTRWDRTG